MANLFNTKKIHKASDSEWSQLQFIIRLPCWPGHCEQPDGLQYIKQFPFERPAGHGAKFELKMKEYSPEYYVILSFEYPNTILPRDFESGIELILERLYFLDFFSSENYQEILANEHDKVHFVYQAMLYLLTKIVDITALSCTEITAFHYFASYLESWWLEDYFQGKANYGF